MTPNSFTILIVDDEYLGRVAVVDELVERGYRVLEASSGDEALAVLRGARVDLVVTDLRLPGTLDGVGLARAVRTEYPHIRLVAVSGGRLKPEDRTVVDEFLNKPFDLTTICGSVERLLAVPV